MENSNIINTMSGLFESKVFMGSIGIIMILYLLLLLSIFGDLWSGLRKAKIRGEVRSSNGLKRTVDKIARYYNAMLMLTVMDLMQMLSLWFMHDNYDWKIPVFPFITMLGAIGFSIIEVKSMFEKAEEKDRLKYQKLGELLSATIKAKNKPEDIIEELLKYMEIKENEKK